MLRYIPTALCILSIVACSKYEVQVNDKLVYSPPALFSDYQVFDAALKHCLQDSIREQNVTNAKQLTELLCPAGDIQSLEGLNSFLNIHRIGMANNKISGAIDVSRFRKLEYLNIENNAIVEIAGIKQLEGIKYLNIRGNKDLDCRSVSLTPETGLLLPGELFLPKHCE